MGAGAYKLDKYIPGQEVRFVANENYFEGKPKIEHFIYKISKGDTKLQQFQAGEVDYDGFTTNTETIEQLKDLGFANINVYTGSSYGYIKMNYKKPYFKDKRVRQAFIYGLERQKLLIRISKVMLHSLMYRLRQFLGRIQKKGLINMSIT